MVLIVFGRSKLIECAVFKAMSLTDHMDSLKYFHLLIQLDSIFHFGLFNMYKNA